MLISFYPINPDNLLVIKTARDTESMNTAVQKDYKLIVKALDPSPEIESTYRIVQHKKSGEIFEVGDPRFFYRHGGEEAYNILIGWTSHYHYHFKKPFAAYLIPKDLPIGERVWIDDLIEDYVQYTLGFASYRLPSCEAIWTGKELEIQYDPKIYRTTFIG